MNKQCPKGFYGWYEVGLAVWNINAKWVASDLFIEGPKLFQAHNAYLLNLIWKGSFYDSNVSCYFTHCYYSSIINVLHIINVLLTTVFP